MIVRDGIVLLEYADLVGERGLTERMLRRGVTEKVILVARAGGGGHPALYDWATLPTRYKALVVTHLGGDPEELAKAQQVERHLLPVAEDHRYIDTFRAANGRGLVDERRAQLAMASRIMDLLARADAAYRKGGSAAVLSAFGMGAMALKAAVLDYVKANRARLPKQFPTTHARMEARKRAYMAARLRGEPGVSALVHGAQGNANASKLATEDQQALLRRLCARPQNYSHVRIASDYNLLAAQAGWAGITPGTVFNFLRDGANGRAVAVYAKGMGAYQNMYGIVVHRERPSQPTYLWVHDGTDYELLYQKEVAGRTGYHHRKKVTVVLDPHSWYPVGFAIGEEDTVDLTWEAMRDAVRHMRELTGHYALPRQVQSDRMGHKALGIRYAALGVKHTPAGAHNARAKVIEPWWAQHNDHYANRYPNWSGHNITSSKRNQPNPDALNLHKKDFPTEAGVIEQITAAINRERADKMDAFRAALAAMPEGALRTISREQYLLHFGARHPWTNELTNRGLCPTIGGVEVPFNLLSKSFQAHLGTRFQVMYDPADLSDVLAMTEDQAVRYLVPAVERVPMALADHTPHTRSLLASTQAFKLDLGQEAIDSLLNDGARVKELADALILDAARVKRTPATRRTDDVITPGPEEEVVTKNYLTERGGHKAALHTARTEAQRRVDIERWAEDQL